MTVLSALPSAKRGAVLLSLAGAFLAGCGSTPGSAAKSDVSAQEAATSTTTRLTPTFDAILTAVA
ncbi:hypothetical protein [Nonomuraea sp. bgisy101]|uniref:hypothetical protein n=1 Tax=Nonomuraea sp. bgisy101 TaxID=3413784 RepID=UPI003D73AC15